MSHHFLIPRVLDPGEEVYYPVTLSSYFDEASFYAHRAHAAYLGQWWVGDVHTAEYQGGPALMPMLNPLILGGLGRVLGSFERGLIASDFLFPAVIFLLVYAMVFECVSRRLPSLLFASLFLFVPKLGIALPPVSWAHIKEILSALVPYHYGETTLFFTHFEEPKITFVFFALAVWLVIRALKHPMRFNLISAGISFGLLFYTYLYDWMSFASALILLIAWYAARRDSQGVKRAAAILVIGGAVSIPYGINLFMVYQLPHASDLVERAGREISRAFRFLPVWKSYLRIVVLVPLLGFFALRQDTERVRKLAFSGALILSYVMVLNIQVITGFNVQPDHWYRVQFLPIGLSVFLLALAAYDGVLRGRAHLIGRWITVGFLVYFFIGQAYHQYTISSDPAYAKSFVMPRQRKEAYQWLSDHTPKGSVVAALSPETNRELPLHTHNKIYVPHGLLTLAPDEEIWERFFFVNALYGVKPAEFHKRLEKGDTAYYLFEARYDSKEFNSAFRGSAWQFPPSVIDEKTRLFEAYKASGTIVPGFRIDYAYADERDGMYGSFLDPVSWLEKVYERDGVLIYRIK